MRICSACGKEDAPWFESDPCSCGAAKLHEDDPSPMNHSHECRCLGHEVVQFPVRITPADLSFNREDLKSPYYRSRGWKLMKNGLRFYLVKMLCRGCVALENSALERRREYERVCKASRSQDDTTYAQMLAQQ